MLLLSSMHTVAHYTHSNCVLLTVPMHTMLSTTIHVLLLSSMHTVAHYIHINTLFVAIIDCTHAHHVVHYYNTHQCTLLPTYQYTVLLLLLTVPMHTMLSTTHISIHVLLLLYPCTPFAHYTHINTLYCCYY